MATCWKFPNLRYTQKKKTLDATKCYNYSRRQERSAGRWHKFMTWVRPLHAHTLNQKLNNMRKFSSLHCANQRLKICSTNSATNHSSISQWFRQCWRLQVPPGCPERVCVAYSVFASCDWTPNQLSKLSVNVITFVARLWSASGIFCVVE